MLALAGAATAVLTPVAAAVARRADFYDVPHGYKGHARPTPYLGGAAVFAGFLLAAMAGTGGGQRLLAVGACAAGMLALGTLDDRRTVRPRWRVLVEAGAGVVLAVTGHGWEVIGWKPADVVITAAWVIGVVNAFNLMDNLDGAAATLAAVCAAGTGALALAGGDGPLAGLCFALAGACAGFLVHNLASPARIFLGDGGSMTLGLLVAALAATATSRSHLGPSALAAGAMLVGLPILDTVLVVVSRTRAGVPLLTGGRDHLTHRLLARVGSARRVALALGVGQAGLCALAVAGVQRGAPALLGLAVLCLALGAVALGLLESPRWNVRRPLDPLGAPIGLARIISRLNVGGPAIHAISLARELEPLGYRTTLIRGCESPTEGSMDHLAQRLGVRPLRLPALRRDFGWHDVAALPALVAALRRTRPRVVHTHLAKAGVLGRIAALVACPRAVRVHTFHGHSLTGYFSPRRSRVHRWVERFLARRTHRLVAVSEQVRDDLVGLGIAPSERFEVIPLGLDLNPFTVAGEERVRRREALRRSLAIPATATVVTLAARLVPIKRVDRFLRVATMLAASSDVMFLVVGDGELGDELRASAAARALGPRLVWAGWRHDMPDVHFASDVVVLTSDNEGTPVSLIEARAAGVPVVSTAVGGVAAVVGSSEAARLVDPADEAAFARAVQGLLADLPRATAAGNAARAQVARAYSLDALASRLDALYRSLLGPTASSEPPLRIPEPGGFAIDAGEGPPRRGAGPVRSP